MFDPVKEFFGVFGWFLQPKLIAGETHDFEFVAIVRLECIKVGVLVSVGSKGGHVNHEEDFVLKVRKLDLLLGRDVHIGVVIH